MNALELADIQAFKTEELTMWERNTTATMLRNQQAKIEALKDFAIWMTGCGYDFCQHNYFNKCRDELLVGKAQEK